MERSFIGVHTLLAPRMILNPADLWPQKRGEKAQVRLSQNVNILVVSTGSKEPSIHPNRRMQNSLCFSDTK